MSTHDGHDPDETTAPPTEPGSGPSASGMPAKIGPYVIKRVIASGGMGTVYEALQENPRRPAAVKVIRRSMASSEILRRFEREAQALARLRHPGIAQIYEAGTYQDGGVTLPFFALEYIPNARDLIAFALSRDLDVRGRLELFLQVCDAVHYGHQRGIIHRDLKPGNILVDSEGRVRVIDFGVARAVDADQEDPDQQTRVGQIVGTAQYMSPEQYEADPNDLDTRSDVYTLGVVLFELISGRLPYEIAQTGVFEIARIVREEQPAALRSVAAGVDGEIELIAAKALAKDRESRYQSAYGMAQDIRRHLKGEAIEAKPTSLSYQARVFARKNKAAVGLAAATVALLVVGILWTSKLYVEVSAARTRAEASAEHAIAANEFLTGALASVVPPGFGDVRTIGDLCDRVALDIDGAFPNSPTTEADVRQTIGQIYWKLDKRPQAEQQLRKAFELHGENLGPTHPSTARALDDLNTYYSIFGPSAKYVETAQQKYQLSVELYGLDHPDVHTAREYWIHSLDVDGDYAGAEKMAREFREEIAGMRGEDSVAAMAAVRDHALQQLAAGQVAAARASAKDAYQRFGTLPDVNPGDAQAARNTYAATLVADGDLAGAKELYGHLRAPDPMSVEDSYQGDLGDMDEAVQVLVFFETWCPYSQRYIPKLERLNRQYRDLGISVVGLTSVSRSSSDDNVRRFISDNEMSFAVFKENGRCSSYFDLAAVPMTVILHRGEVVWKSAGSGWLNNHILEGIVAADRAAD